jgi:hypothetical protein
MEKQQMQEVKSPGAGEAKITQSSGNRTVSFF